MEHIKALTEEMKARRSPAQHLGAFLLQHSNSPEYLVGNLEAFLEAAKADLEASRRLTRSLHSLIEDEPATPDVICRDADTWDAAEHLAMVAAVNGGNVHTERTATQLHIYRSGEDRLLAIVTVAEATDPDAEQAAAEASDPDAEQAAADAAELQRRQQPQVDLLDD